MVTQAALAAYLDLSQQAVSKLKAAGILPAPSSRGGYDRDGARVAYIRHLREAAAGRASEDREALDLVAERARLAAAQAEAQERKNARERGELVDVVSVNFAMTSLIGLAVSRLERVGAIVAGNDPALRRRIDTAVTDALEDLSTVTKADLLGTITAEEDN